MPVHWRNSMLAVCSQYCVTCSTDGAMSVVHSPHSRCPHRRSSGDRKDASATGEANTCAGKGMLQSFLAATSLPVISLYSQGVHQDASFTCAFTKTAGEGWRTAHQPRLVATRGQVQNAGDVKANQARLSSKNITSFHRLCSSPVKLSLPFTTLPFAALREDHSHDVNEAPLHVAGVILQRGRELTLCATERPLGGPRT